MTIKQIIANAPVTYVYKIKEEYTQEIQEIQEETWIECCTNKYSFLNYRRVKDFFDKVPNYGKIPDDCILLEDVQYIDLNNSDKILILKYDVTSGKVIREYIKTDLISSNNHSFTVGNTTNYCTVGGLLRELLETDGYTLFYIN